MSYSILQNADKAVVRMEPFPHIIIDDALPQDVFERLAQSYPDANKMPHDRRTMNNQRYNLLSRWGATELPIEEASEDWEKFIDANESTEFVERAFSLFPEYVRQDEEGQAKIDLAPYGPQLADKINTDELISFEDVKPRVTVAVNTPVKKSSSVRGPHTDHMRKAYVGLLYFRLPEDDSTGGDLEVFKWKNGEPKSHWPVAVDGNDVEQFATFHYRPNRLIFFLTNDRALHGVSPRSVTPYWRRLVVISGWFPGVDYSDTDTMHGRFAGILAKVKGRARRMLGRERVTAD